VRAVAPHGALYVIPCQQYSGCESRDFSQSINQRFTSPRRKLEKDYLHYRCRCVRCSNDDPIRLGEQRHSHGLFPSRLHTHTRWFPGRVWHPLALILWPRATVNAKHLGRCWELTPDSAFRHLNYSRSESVTGRSVRCSIPIVRSRGGASGLVTCADFKSVGPGRKFRLVGFDSHTPPPLPD
jgi:hypothetical protein